MDTAGQGAHRSAACVLTCGLPLSVRATGQWRCVSTVKSDGATMDYA